MDIDLKKHAAKLVYITFNYNLVENAYFQIRIFETDM